MNVPAPSEDERLRGAVHLTITGRVQGVLFREWTMVAARDLGLAGWVRNRSDGTVEATFEGEERALERMTELARTGPPLAKVFSVTSKAIRPEGLTGFERHATL